MKAYSKRARLRDAETLDIVDFDRAQLLLALIALHHFGDGANPDHLAHPLDGADLGERFGHAQDLQNNGAVDLEEIQRQRLDVIETDARATEPVQGEAASQRLEYVGEAGGLGQARYRVAIFNLETQRLAGYPVLLQRADDELRERAVLDACARQVDA